MKLLITLLSTTILFAACSSNKQGSGNSHEKAAQTDLKKIIKIVKAGDPSKLAPFVVYRGDNQEERWKRVCNYKNSSEKNYVNQIFEQIKRVLGPELNYTYKKYDSETESEGTWHALFLETTHEGENKERIFAFLKINGTYALGDID